MRPIPEDSEVDTHSSWIVFSLDVHSNNFLDLMLIEIVFFLPETRLSTEWECCEECYEDREASLQFFETRFHIFFMLKART